MISAFGEKAQRYAAGLDDLEVIIAEPEQLFHAYFEALRRRERGESFYGMILADDARVALAYNVSLSIVTQFPDIDIRERAFAALAAGTVQVGDRTAADVWNETPPYHLVAIEFYRLCSAMLVRSYTEFAAFAQRSNGFARPLERVLSEPALPGFEHTVPPRPAVVVWGPHRPSAHLALHLAALAEFPGDVWCVAADETAGAGKATVITARDPRVAEVLARAGCVVCVEPNDPGDAVAFARAGVGIVAPLTSGAHEFVPNAVVWDAANATTLYAAVARALARPAAARTQAAGSLPRAPVRSPEPMPREQLPLVSVVIPTYNRPEDLRAALSAVAAQTYPNVEAVVVNDGGTAVADVVAAFPFARLIEHAANAGSIAAAETGYKHAKGEYIQFLPDDDSIYPDHIERVMFAMLRTGAKIAHGNGMLRYVERAPGGGWKTTGVNATLCSETLTPTTALIATPVSENAVIQHRSVFEEAGWMLTDSSLADVELHMRLGQRWVFVHADDITFEFREHAHNQAKLLDFPTELMRLYEQLHPAPGRPILATYRQQAHAGMAARVPGQPAFPPTIRVT
jgi:Glycosyl transferase family 2